MTKNEKMVIESLGVDPRVERLLDAAAELLVRWGYRRVTVEDVANRAGIGKGTVYLHFRTKEALFLTVLLRVQRAVARGMAARLRVDPTEALPGRMVASLYLAFVEDPVTSRIYLGDSDAFGRLAHEAASTLGELTGQREEVLRRHFQLLRDAGLLRAEPDLAAQLYLFGAVAAGFFFTDSQTMPGAPSDPAVRARLLEHALACALQPRDVPRPSRELAEAVAALYESLTEYIDIELRRRVR